MTTTLQRLALDELAKCAHKLRERQRFSVNPASVRVLYDLRGKSRAGLALPHIMTIRLSPDYFAALGEKYRATVAHEYAHLVVRAEEQIYAWRRSPSHGKRWQSVMLALGYKPERTLDDGERALAVNVKPARRVAKYRYVCALGHEHWLGPKRHARAQRGSTWLCCEGSCRFQHNDVRRIKYTP